MTAVWTTPKTWVANEFVDATEWNTHLRDNLDWLKTPPAITNYVENNTSTTSTTLTNMADMSGVITVVTGKVLVGYTGAMTADIDTRRLGMAFAIDGSAPYVTTLTEIGTNLRMVSWLERWTLAPGARTVAIQWQTSAGTMSQNGASTTGRWFFVSEYT